MLVNRYQQHSRHHRQHHHQLPYKQHQWNHHCHRCWRTVYAVSLESRVRSDIGKGSSFIVSLACEKDEFCDALRLGAPRAG